MCDLIDVILQHPKLSRADLATLAAIEKLGGGVIYREEIARLAGVTVWQVSRCVKHLDLCGVASAKLTRKDGKNRNSYTVAECANAHNTQIEPSINEVRVSDNPEKCASAHPYHDDEDMDNEIKKELDFLDKAGLSKLLKLPHLTLEMAQAWRKYKDWRDQTGWGDIKRPVGYVYREIERGNWPTIQEELPEGALDLSQALALYPERFADKIKEQYEQGLCLTSEGYWR